MTTHDQEFRAFVRTHHPDRGGDPVVFAAGLAAFGRGTKPRPAVTVVPARSTSARLRRGARRMRRVLTRTPSRATPLR